MNAIIDTLYAMGTEQRFICAILIIMLICSIGLLRSPGTYTPPPNRIPPPPPRPKRKNR